MNAQMFAQKLNSAFWRTLSVILILAFLAAYAPVAKAQESTPGTRIEEEIPEEGVQVVIYQRMANEPDADGNPVYVVEALFRGNVEYRVSYKGQLHVPETISVDTGKLWIYSMEYPVAYDGYKFEVMDPSGQVALIQLLGVEGVKTYQTASLTVGDWDVFQNYAFYREPQLPFDWAKYLIEEGYFENTPNGWQEAEEWARVLIKYGWMKLPGALVTGEIPEQEIFPAENENSLSSWCQLYTYLVLSDLPWAEIQVVTDPGTKVQVIKKTFSGEEVWLDELQPGVADESGYANWTDYDLVYGETVQYEAVLNGELVPSCIGNMTEVVREPETSFEPERDYTFCQAEVFEGEAGPAVLITIEGAPFAVYDGVIRTDMFTEKDMIVQDLWPDEDGDGILLMEDDSVQLGSAYSYSIWRNDSEKAACQVHVAVPYPPTPEPTPDMMEAGMLPDPQETTLVDLLARTINSVIAFFALVAIFFMLMPQAWPVIMLIGLAIAGVVALVTAIRH